MKHAVRPLPLLAMLLFAASCSRPATPAATDGSRFAFEQRGELTTARVEAYDAVDGRRPILSIVCAQESAPRLEFDVVRQDMPIKTREAIGYLQIGDVLSEAPIRLEQIETGRWFHKVTSEALLRAILSDHRVMLRPPGSAQTNDAIIWDIGGLGDALATLERSCAVDTGSR